MVWGDISVRSRTELLVLNGTLTGQRYINEVLQPVVLPFVQQHHVVLQDDNARPHRLVLQTPTDGFLSVNEMM